MTNICKYKDSYFETSILFNFKSSNPFWSNGFQYNPEHCKKLSI